MRHPIHLWIVLLWCVLVTAGCGAAPSTSPASPATLAPAGSPTPGATRVSTSPPPGSTPLATAATAPAATPTVAARPTATGASSTPPNADPRAALLQALQRLQQGGPYRTRTMVTDTATGTTVSTSQAEIIPPDRYHIVESLPTRIEVIVIGAKAYSKDQSGNWGAANPQMAGTLVQAQQVAQAAQIGAVQVTGPDTLNGVPVLVYTFTETANVGSAVVTSAVKLWVGLANGLPLQQQVDGDFQGVKSRTVQSIEYDPTIQINPPL